MQHLYVITYVRNFLISHNYMQFHIIMAIFDELYAFTYKT